MLRTISTYLDGFHIILAFNFMISSNSIQNFKTHKSEVFWVHQKIGKTSSIVPDQVTVCQYSSPQGVSVSIKPVITTMKQQANQEEPVQLWGDNRSSHLACNS